MSCRNSAVLVYDYYETISPGSALSSLYLGR